MGAGGGLPGWGSAARAGDAASSIAEASKAAGRDRERSDRKFRGMAARRGGRGMDAILALRHDAEQADTPEDTPVMAEAGLPHAVAAPVTPAAPAPRAPAPKEIGRASWRERVCQYVSISVVAGSLKKKTNTRTKP